MKTFSATLIAPLALAQVYPNRGATNASLEGSFGFGYNVGNGYDHTDSHGNDFGHQTVQGQPELREGYGYTQDQATAHIYGYDSVHPQDDATWTATFATPVGTTAAPGAYTTAIRAAVLAAHDDRIVYIQGVLNKRINRLMEIHQDNLLKIQAPFELQLDLLESEISDVNTAMTQAEETANSYFFDLIGGTDADGFVWTGRMVEYLEDRKEALNRESTLVERTLRRAYEEAKPVDEVLYAMRIDWLQGVYVSGDQAIFDTNVWDDTVMDSEFDIFTYDIGHGKGHGHTAQGNRGNERTNAGFVVGVGIGENDLSTLRGAPGPVDGKTRRYDRMTLSGNGGAGLNSDYELGVRQAQKDGQFGFDQEASL